MHGGRARRRVHRVSSTNGRIVRARENRSSATTRGGRRQNRSRGRGRGSRPGDVNAWRGRPSPRAAFVARREQQVEGGRERATARR